MKKVLLFIFVTGLLLSNSLFAYDAVIKDNYGRVTDYMDQDGDKIYIVDKYGRRGDYIEADGDIKDKYCRKKGKIEKRTNTVL